MHRLAHGLRGPLSPLQTATVRLARNDTRPARIDIDLVAPARVRLLRHIGCSGNAVELAEERLDAPLPDPQDDGLGPGLLVARAIADAHDGSLRFQAIDAASAELIRELALPCESAVSLSAA